jgi:hypothetical protein
MLQTLIAVVLEWATCWIFDRISLALFYYKLAHILHIFLLFRLVAAVRQMLVKLGTPKSHNVSRQWANFVPAQSPMQPSTWRNELNNFAAAEAYAKQVYETHLRSVASLSAIAVNMPQSESILIAA